MRFLLLAALILGVVSCKDNPYPVDINSSNVTGEGKPDEVIRRSGLSADVPDIISFTEGFQDQHTFRVAVPEPGTPEVEIKNLPDGATFDPETYTLSWTPGFFDGNDPNDPSIKSRIYTVEFWLRSSLINNEAISKEVSLVVFDRPRAIEVKSSPSDSVSEGETLEFEFSIENLDYPNGPFKVAIDNFPENSYLEKLSDTQYKLTFSPGYDFVTIYDGNKNYSGTIFVTNPAGHQMTKKIGVNVLDSRLDPIIDTPETLTQGLDLSFQVISHDPNKEVAPKITVTSNLGTNIGNYSIEYMEDKKNFSTVAKVTWSDLPPSHNGETISFTIQSCVRSSSYSYGQCTYTITDITLVVRDKLPPIISRSAWPVGEMKYYSFNKRVSYYMNIKDAHNHRLTPKVEIFPEEMRKYVSWSGNSLVIQVDQPGTYQFNIRATSEYKIQASESFLFEVFPETRSPFLLFADSTRDSEVQYYRSIYPNLSIMNPAIQDINERNISGRDTLLLTTSIIQDKSVHAKMVDGIKKIKNIIIASPLIAQLPEVLLKEIRESYGVTIRGRYSDFPLPALDTGFIVTRQDFQRPVGNIGLMGSASSESMSPALFSTGVDTRSCKAVMEFTDITRSFREQLAIICDRDNGGRMVLLGTEWADFKVGADDSDIVKLWLENALSTEVDI